MTDTPLPPSPGDSAPIDAEFEPAPRRPKKAKADNKSGPGWFSFGVLGLIALASLGLAAAASGFIPGFSKDTSEVDTLKQDVLALKAGEDLNKEAFQKITRDLSQTQNAQKQIQNYRKIVDQRLEDLEGALAILETDIAGFANSDQTDQGSETVPEAEPRDETTAPETVIAQSDLDSRFAELEDRIAQLGAITSVTETHENSAPEISAELGAIEADITSLKDRLNAVETALSEQPDLSEALTSRNEDAALALSAIEAAARRGRPFLAAQQRLETALPNSAAIKRLEPIAADAIPTLSDLREDFPDLKRKAINTDAQSEGGATGWMRTLFGDGVTVRRAGEVTAADHLEKASNALSENDLDSAIEAVEALDSDVQTVFTDWLDNARKRQTLENTLEALRLTMISKDRP